MCIFFGRTNSKKINILVIQNLPENETISSKKSFNEKDSENKILFLSSKRNEEIFVKKVFDCRNNRCFNISGGFRTGIPV